MAFYTNSGTADMQFMYGRANGHTYEARRLYAEAFPNRAIPSDKLFSRLHQRLSENGSFIVHNAGRPRSTATAETEENVLARVEENPNISTRTIAGS
ncbi:helix-turn-helix domain [Holotrichia oblita]|uniref:Helix-turn-helix domain n=1 Tax=Holotrichia oblita TaxID=644536 RepID=A0ACB9TQF8_HOLOL|nr:helix-turn-helix domain [Holotrichia oblita]